VSNEMNIKFVKEMGIKGVWPPTANVKRPAKEMGILHTRTQRYGKVMECMSDGTPEDSMKL